MKFCVRLFFCFVLFFCFFVVVFFTCRFSALELNDFGLTPEMYLLGRQRLLHGYEPRPHFENENHCSNSNITGNIQDNHTIKKLDTSVLNWKHITEFPSSRAVTILDFQLTIIVRLNQYYCNIYREK